MMRIVTCPETPEFSKEEFPMQYINSRTHTEELQHEEERLRQQKEFEEQTIEGENKSKTKKKKKKRKSKAPKQKLKRKKQNGNRILTAIERNRGYNHVDEYVDHLEEMKRQEDENN